MLKIWGFNVIIGVFYKPFSYHTSVLRSMYHNWSCWCHMSGSIGYHIAQWRLGCAVSFHVLFNLKIQRRFHASDAMLLVVTLRKLVFFLSSLHHSRHASCYAEHTAVRL